MRGQARTTTTNQAAPKPEWGQSIKAHTVIMGKGWGGMDFVKALASHEDGDVKEALKASVSKKQLNEKQIAEQAESYHPHRFSVRGARLGTAAARRRQYLDQQREAAVQDAEQRQQHNHTQVPEALAHASALETA